MQDKIEKIIFKIDHFFYKKFGSHKSTKILENIKEAHDIFYFLNENEEENTVRFVGGCVRKALCGEQIDDIDLATSLKPDEVKKKLSKNNIKVIDTGILHGTVTAILNKKKFEITTLRKDISTDGRHATVQFTSNWEEDASRRDFTINAIYADIDGRIFDPFNGKKDLLNGEINFIGSTEERIQEDYLRILRYFRFFIQYNKTHLDENSLRAIKKNINGLNKISKERIFDELKKILDLKSLHILFSHNDLKEIFLEIFPQLKYYERLNRLNNLSNETKDKFDRYLILALLIIDNSQEYEYFCHKYKVSNATFNRFKNIFSNYENMKSKKFYSEKNIKKIIYFKNKKDVIDLLLFLFCSNIKIKNFEITELINYVNKYKIPKFPISGDYLKELGYESGRALGKKLKSIEEQWIENNFIMDKELIEKNLGKKEKN
jgi:poly(A) polymerase